MRTILTHHYHAEITGLKLGEGQVYCLGHAGAQPLAEQGIEVQGAPHQLHMTLLQDGDVAIWGRGLKLVGIAFSSEPLVQDNTGGERGVRGRKFKITTTLERLVAQQCCRLRNSVAGCMREEQTWQPSVCSSGKSAR